MKKKNMGSYYCKKCKHEHKLNSKIGKSHLKHKRKSSKSIDLNRIDKHFEKIEKMIEKEKPEKKKSSYYCKKCKRKHKKNTKIEKKHKIYKKKTKTEDKKEKLSFLKNFSERLKKRKEKKEEKEEILKKPSHIIKVTLVKEVMVRNPVHIKRSGTLSEAFEILKKYNLKSLIVTENEKPIGIINEEEILAFFSSFVKMEKGALEENKNILDNLSKQNVFAGTISMSETVEPTTHLEDAIKIMTSKEIDQLPVVNASGKIIGAVFENDIISFIRKKSEKQETTGTEIIETSIDKLFDTIKNYKEITAKDAAERLKISEKTIENWAKILESHGLIDIDYSTIGTIKLIKKEKKFF